MKRDCVVTSCGLLAISLLALQPAISQTQAECPPGATCWNAVKDFSITLNPNDVWQYGWTATLGSPLNLYTVTDTTSVPGISAWLARGEFWGDPPYIAHNDTSSTVCYAGYLCLPPTFFSMHPGPENQYSVLRWVAPSAGVYRIQVAFSGLGQSPPTTDVHVLVNSTESLLTGPLASSVSPMLVLLRAQLSPGDTVDFAVGFLSINNMGDSTGVAVGIVKTPAVCTSE